MKRHLFLSACLTIVAAIRPAIAAPSSVSDDVPVPGGVAAFAQMLRIDPAPDRGRFMYEVTRILLQNDPEHSPEIAAARFKTVLSAQFSVLSSDVVPVPLTSEWWSSHVFHRKVSRNELVAAIVSDRQAAMICHALSALDDDTLQFFAEHGGVVSHLIDKLAGPSFAAFSSHVRIRTNRIMVVPEEATPLWEAVLQERTTRPERFLELLFEASDGRVAYLFDTIAQLDPARRAFALGLWMPDAAVRAARFRVLATDGVGAFHDWHVHTMPLGRASWDLGMALARVDAAESGVPASPLPRAFWIRALTGRDSAIGDAAEPLDAAWLATTIGAADVRQRRERLDQLAFGQRLVRRAPPDSDRESADAEFAIRALPRYHMLLVGLERMGVQAPAVYAASIRHAQRLARFDGHRGFVLQAQFQGALALVARAAAVRTIDRATAEMLVAGLVDLPVADDGRYAGAVAAWIRDAFAPAVPRAADLESAAIAAISGGASGERNRPMLVTWEGEQYRLDLGAAERQRLLRVREKQEAIALDAALAVVAAGRAAAVDPDGVQPALDRLDVVVEDLPRWSRERDRADTTPGVPAIVYRDALKKARDDVAAARPNDRRRFARVLVDVGDDMLASSLLSLAYAAAVGDPDGTVLLAGDVSRRHDFGFGGREADNRQRGAWTEPRVEVIPNVPWHVSGSLVGLDIALAPLALRRINSDGVLEPPRLVGPERDAFALTVSLINPFALTDADRRAITAAVARGTRRAQAATGAEIDAIADEIALDGSRRRALHWTIAHEPSRVVSLLTMTELLVLGGGRPETYAAWGTAVAGSFGCFCTELPTPARWWPMARRPQLGLTASVVSDLNLHVAVMLDQLQLPAALAKVVLAAAAQDFIDGVKPTDPGDWLTLVRTARAASRERIEDYVAAATAGGPLIPVASAQQ